MKKISRTNFLKELSLLMGGAAMLPYWSPLFSRKNGFSINSFRDLFNDKILVMVNLNGGNDGLNTVIPYQDDNYYNLRPNIAIPGGSVIPLTDELGLHPELTQLASFWNQGKLCIIENVGYANQNLSHFRSTDIWQSGSSSDEVIETGWIARVLEEIYPDHVENLPEVPMSLLQGTTNNLLIKGALGIAGIMIDDPSTFLNLINSTFYDSPDDIIPDTYGGDELQFIRNVDNTAIEYAEYIQNASDGGINTVEYANNSLSIQLSSVAKLISGGMYSPFFITYQSGYDTHSDQINRHGQLLSDLSLALNNFYSDLNNQGLSEKVIIMTTSEFGRRPYQNGSSGTDHGAAAPIIVIGDKVNGGLIGNQPNLIDFDYNENLLYEYDYRQIYASILKQHFDLSNDIIEQSLLNTFDTIDLISNDQLGDVNFDGELNVIDIVIMVNFILGYSIPTEEEFLAADINGDGNLDILDIVSATNIILNNNSFVQNNLLDSVVEIHQHNNTIKIPKNNDLGGIEIHFNTENKITNFSADENWIVKGNLNNIIIYSKDLKSMKKDFIIEFNEYSNINDIIVSNKKGNKMKYRIFKQQNNK